MKTLAHRLRNFSGLVWGRRVNADILLAADRIEILEQEIADLRRRNDTAFQLAEAAAVDDLNGFQVAMVVRNALNPVLPSKEDLEWARGVVEKTTPSGAEVSDG